MPGSPSTMKFSVTALSMALLSTCAAVAQACQGYEYIVGHYSPLDKHWRAPMEFFLTVPSGYTHWGKVDLGYVQELNRVTSTDGQVRYGAVWQKRRFDFMYGNKWYHHQGAQSDQWLERSYKWIRFNGCL